MILKKFKPKYIGDVFHFQFQGGGNSRSQVATVWPVLEIILLRQEAYRPAKTQLSRYQPNPSL